MSWLVWIQTFSFPPPAACSWGRGRPQLSVTLAFTSRYQTNIPWPIVHRKKSFSIFPSPARMSLYILSLGGNNDVIYKLFPPRESLVSDIPVGDGNIKELFLPCTTGAVRKFSFSCRWFQMSIGMWLLAGSCFSTVKQWSLTEWIAHF